ncbi:MAG: DUF4124 domain-containing protein [Pseudomonadota bacterium]
MFTRFTFLLLAGLAGPALADAPIYLCVDANGHKELTDTNKAGCKMLDVPGLIPAPPKKWDGAQKPRLNVPMAPAPAPGSFPQVGSAEQRARDADRRGILAEELRSEEQKLAQAKREFNNGEPERRGDEKNFSKYQDRVNEMREQIARAEKNVEALKREIATIK